MNINIMQLPIENDFVSHSYNSIVNHKGKNPIEEYKVVWSENVWI